MPGPRRNTPLLRRALAGAVLALLALAGPAAAAEAPASSFALEPLQHGPGVSYMVFESDAGKTIESGVRVKNTGRAAGRVRLYAVDATTGRTTGAVYHSDRHARRDVGAWTKLAESELALGPGESRVVSFVTRVPSDVTPGQHLGGVVAEDLELKGTGEQKRGNGSFAVKIRKLTIVGLQVDIPGPHVENLSLTGVKADEEGGFPAVLVGMRNGGTQLIKGKGKLVLRDSDGEVVRRVRFPVDTLVPDTGIENPVYAGKRPLEPGTYRAAVTVRYGHGRIASLSAPLEVGSGSKLATGGPDGPGKDLGWVIQLLIALALGLLCFTGGLLVSRRRNRRAARAGEALAGRP